jgi:hypothetical protein
MPEKNLPLNLLSTWKAAVEIEPAYNKQYVAVVNKFRTNCTKPMCRDISAAIAGLMQAFFRAIEFACVPAVET